MRDSFAAMALVLDLMAALGIATLAVGCRAAPLYDDQGSVSDPGRRSRGSGWGVGAEGVSALWDRIASAFPDARVDRRDGLRLEWDDRWVHIRASNTEPIVRVIAEAVDPADAHELTGRIGRWVSTAHGVSHMSTSIWPTFPKPPSVAFVDVDGTLLAHTTTFLFARILYRKGWIRRSFFLRALHHGLQHKFGRLDYGRLIEIGLTYISRIPVVELERIAYENFVEFVRPRLYEGVVDHLSELRRSGTPIVLVSSSPRLVIEPLGIYLGCTRSVDDPGHHRAWAVDRDRLGSALLW